MDMRGDEERQEAVFVFDLTEDCVPADHPLRRIRRLTDTALRDLDPSEELYAETGRPPSRPIASSGGAPSEASTASPRSASSASTSSSTCCFAGS